jgi:hypothetical protein
MALGGRRPGAGRPKAGHTIKTEEMRKALVEFVRVHMNELMAAQLDLARGVQVAKSVKLEGEYDEKLVVYREKPDNKAIDSLFHQSIGKPKESMELSGSLEVKHKDLLTVALKKDG